MKFNRRAANGQGVGECGTTVRKLSALVVGSGGWLCTCTCILARMSGHKTAAVVK